MNISRREKIGIVILIVIALIVFMFPEDGEFQAENGTTVSTNQLNVLTAKFKRIKPLKWEKKEKTEKTEFNLKRNIFKFGAAIPRENGFFNDVETLEQTNVNTEKEKQEKTKNSQLSPPPIDFKILGIIKADQRVKAIVVVRGPELFVFKEGDTMFSDFVCKKIENKKVVIGFTDFDFEKTINLDNKGGF